MTPFCRFWYHDAMQGFETAQKIFGNAPQMGSAFGMVAVLDGSGGADRTGFDAQDTAQDSATRDGLSGQFAEQSRLDYNPRSPNRMEKTLHRIETMLDSQDYQGAAEEILKIRADDVPNQMFDRFKDALSDASYGLSGKKTYLNAQLAAQSLAVTEVEMERAERAAARKEPRALLTERDYVL